MKNKKYTVYVDAIIRRKFTIEAKNKEEAEEEAINIFKAQTALVHLPINIYESKAERERL